MPPRKRTSVQLGRPLARIKADIVRALRRLKQAEGSDRTPLYRDLAAHTVALREHFLTAQGTPDWIGRTSAYRHTVRDLYSAADYTPEEADGVQSAIRYHIGNLVREVLHPEALEDLGLDEISPLERARETRRDQTILLARARELLKEHPELLNLPEQE
jgi:hypothetical protein